MKCTNRPSMAFALVFSGFLCAAPAWAHDERPNTSGSSHAVAAQREPFGRSGVSKDVARTIPITLSDTMRFIPEKLTFKQGETIRLRITNAGKIPHEFVLGTKEEIAEHAEMMRRIPGMSHAEASSVQVAPERPRTSSGSSASWGSFCSRVWFPAIGKPEWKEA